MEFERDLRIKEFISLGAKHCSKINLNYFNCIEANSLISDYLFPETRDFENLPDDNSLLIAQNCDREHGFTECNGQNN